MPHDWVIDEREYRRHEARRGRRFAYERLDPVRTALVVVDMVPFFVEGSETNLGIVANIGALATELRARGGTVAWVVPGVPPAELWAVQEEFYGADVARTYRASGGEGTIRERLWHGFDVREDVDVLVEKTAASAFFPGRCDLHERLRERDVDTVLITGTVTNVCCESTARDASTLGLRVIMIADGMSALRDKEHNATLHTIYRSFGDVRTTEEVVGLISGQAVQWIGLS